jgi:hypothetical protein
MDPSSSSTQSSDKLRQDLLDAQVALDQGDYVSVKRRLKTLSDPAIPVPSELRDDVERLRSQVASDPAARYLALGCLAFFLVVALRYVF